ncbi:phage shock protein C (PspC) family protein [Streptomyces zhaozhouensis]|uniref:Phage shock protein C (PspC) family protein n=1 Tax=Streptomyces zhaozhouensis TaxID=1300267 RepID=A0A286DTI3_9ACTN|nr:PspC domain-containing protein [Streptomyces zhaozhouensis]SOD61960.1 phage shock protein C (PspC) family protein [Streptomyces zhaozhouensis]
MTDDRTWPGAGTGPTSTATPPAPAEAPLRRSRKHKVIGGVCGGFGRHYRMDPVIFRVSLVVLSVLGGLGLVVYGVAWLITPFEGEEENEGRRLLSGRVEGPGLTALLFVVAGCGLLLASLGGSRTTTWFSLEVLAALAAAAYWAKYRRGAEQETTPEGTPAHPKLAQAAAEAPPEARRPPAPSGPSWWRGNAGQASYLWGPEQAAPGDYTQTGAPPAGRPPAPGSAGRPGGPPVPPPQPRELRLGGLVFLGAVLAFGAGLAASWASQPLGPALVVGFSSALVVFAVGLVVSAFWGRLGAGTIVSVLLTGAMLAGASVLPENITTSWESHEWRPGDAEMVRPQYELGSGQAELDLTGVDLEAGGTLATEVRAGAGEVTVLVPYDVDLEVSVDIGAGAFTYQPLRGLGDNDNRDSWGGFGQDRLLEYPAVVDAAEETEREAAGETVENARMELRLEMGIGHVQVQRAGEEPRP